MVHIPGVRHKAPDAVSHHPTGSTNPDLLPLPDDIATIKIPTSFFPFDPTMHPILAGICCEELPLESCSHQIDDKLTSSAVSALSTMAITWDRVKLATTSDKDLTQLVSIIVWIPTVYHLPYISITSSANTYIQLMESYFTRTTSSYHLHYGNIYWLSSTQPTRVSLQRQLVQNHLFFGQALPLPSQPYEQTAVTVTPWHLHSPVLHHSHPPHQHTHSRVFVLTFSNIRASIISSW